MLIIAIFALTGYIKGFIKTFTSMTFFILAAVLVYFTTPYVDDFLKNYTPLYQVVAERCESMIVNPTAEEEDETEGERRTEEQSETEEVDNVEERLENSIIEGLPLPDALKTQIKDNNTIEGYQKMAADSFKQYLATYLANIIINILTYIITLILVLLVLRMTIMTLDVIANLPILHGINQVFGLLIGAAQGLLFVWIGFLIMTVFSQTELCEKLFVMVNESPFLKLLYNSNFFLTYLLKIIG